MGSIVICYHVNTIGREFNWTRKDCPQMGTVGYNGLSIRSLRLSFLDRIFKTESKVYQQMTIVQSAP